MMVPPLSPPPSTLPLSVVLLLVSFLPPSLVSSSGSHLPLSWTSPQDPCYHLDGRPRHCLSEFINAAYGVPVNTTRSGLHRDDDITTLTDLHNPHNLTCWTAPEGLDAGDRVLTLPLGRRFEVTYVSLQFCHQGQLSDPISISILKSMDFGRSWRPMQHYSTDCPGQFGLPTLTVAQTRHQETEPLCSDPRPLQKQRGGMVLAFSTLDGRPSSPDFDYSPTLQDWVTATDIRVVFHRVPKKGGSSEKTEGAQRGSDENRGSGVWRRRPGSKGHNGDQVDKTNTGTTLDSDSRETRTRKKGGKMDKQGRKGHQEDGREEDGHNVTSKDERDSFSADLLTPRKGGKGRGPGRKTDSNHWSACPDEGCHWTVEGRSRSNKGRELRKRRNYNLNRRQRVRSVQTTPVSTWTGPGQASLALSDLQVGGRCKCNGHASRCRRDNTGQTVCVCEHHTAGPDCDVCEDFYLDRPWHRATPTHPNPCIACECNGHSKKCRFSMEVFQQSGRRSGGVCQKCRHHTTGRHCQTCQNGYTRDHSKPLNHRKACQPCQCHPVGAAGRWCNQTSGQCLCREGVAGPRCNRCGPGYRQGTSPLRPCIRVQEVVPTPLYQPQYGIAEECVSYCGPSQVKVHMSLETFCQKDYVLKVQFRGMERSGPWWQFSISVQTVYRTGSTSQVRRGSRSLWVPDRDLSCGCPALHVGWTYLLISAEDGERGWGPEERRLVADRSTLALPWREHWSARLRGFRGQDKRGRCPPKGPAHRGRSEARYVPPHLLTEGRGTPMAPHTTDTMGTAGTAGTVGTALLLTTTALVCSTGEPPTGNGTTRTR